MEAQIYANNLNPKVDAISETYLNDPKQVTMVLMDGLPPLKATTSLLDLKVHDSD